MIHSEPHYDWLYAELGDIWGDTPGRLVARMAQCLQPGVALDVGCGSGKNALRLARAGWLVEAFDTSEIAVWLAHAKLAGTGVSIRCEDLRGRTYELNRYDAIVLYGVAHCLSDRELAGFAEAARQALKPNGRLQIAAFTPDISPPDGHFRRPVYARTPEQVLRAFGAPVVEHLETGQIEEDHGGLVSRHCHSMCWMTLRFS